jgi:DNA modification methylase
MSAPAPTDAPNQNVFLNRIAQSYLIGDCSDMLTRLPANFADFVEIDPPYAIDLNNAKRGGTDGYDHYNEIDRAIYLDFMQKVLAESFRVLKNDGWLVLWFGPEPWFEPLYQLLIQTGFSCKRIPAVWVKPTGQTQSPNNHLANCYEMFFYARKSADAALHMPGRSNVFAFPPVSPNYKRHPTERPAELIQALLDTFTIENCQVVVPFAGSGRTMLEAWKMKRQAVGYDLSEDYRNGFLEALSQEVK